MPGWTDTTSPTKPSAASRAGRGDQTAVLAGQADGVGPVDVDRADDVATDLADEHHARDVERLRVGDPEAVDELGLLAEPA